MTTDIEKKEIFFENEDNAQVIDSFLRNAKKVADIEDDAIRTRLSLSKEIIEYIAKAPNQWDEKCQFNIKHFGDTFLQMLRNFNSTKLIKTGIKSIPQNDGETEPYIKYIDEIYFISYRFLCEYDFFVGTGKELVYELRSIKERIQNDKDQMSDYIRSQIIYASYTMPANIIKEFVNDSNIGAFKDFEQKKVEAENLKKKWDKEIQNKKADVDALKDNLETYKIGFNFVGLNNGFLNLANKKAKEAFWLFLSLIGMGTCILGVLIFVFVFITIKGKNIDYLISILPIISIEIILIYFFRIILLNHRSVKAQIIQLELRQALCQFIQSYADYSSKIKTKDANALEKFENLIFSGIVSNPEKLPSTFDGVEQVSEFMKNIKDK